MIISINISVLEVKINHFTIPVTIEKAAIEAIIGHGL